MNIKFKNYTPMFQEGGAVEQAPVEQAPVETAEQDPMQILLEGAAQALQNQDCNIAMQVCQALMQLAQGAPQEAQAPGQPVYKKGGKLSKWI